MTAASHTAYDVVVVEYSEINTFVAEIRRVDVKALGFEHELDRLGGGAIVLDQQNAHVSPLLAAAGSIFSAAEAACGNALGQTDSKR